MDKSPELFWYKTKGILLSTEECEILDRGRVRISLDNADYEGIMDGGHNTFAIARFIIDKLYGISFKHGMNARSSGMKIMIMFWNDLNR